MNQIVFRKDWFAVLRSMSHVRITQLFNKLSELLILLQVNLVWWYIIMRWIVFWKDWIALLWSWSQKRFRIPVNVHLNISSAAELIVTEVGMVIQDHGPKYARRLVSCLQAQGQSEGSFNQIWLFLPYLLNCWSFYNQIWMVHYHKLGVFCIKISLLFSRSRSQWRFKSLLNHYVSHIFCIPDLLATKEGVLICYS